MSDIWVKSKINGIVVKHNNPTFYHQFDDKPVKIPQSVYDFVKKTHADLLDIVEAPTEAKKSKPKVEKSIKPSFEPLPEIKEGD